MAHLTGTPMNDVDRFLIVIQLEGGSINSLSLWFCVVLELRVRVIRFYVFASISFAHTARRFVSCLFATFSREQKAPQRLVVSKAAKRADLSPVLSLTTSTEFCPQETERLEMRHSTRFASALASARSHS